MKALVLFDSESDKLVYKPLVSELKEKFEVEFKVLSAYRGLEALRGKMMKDDFDFVVAGAGFAAHLPGMAAAMTKVPVFGIAVESQFGGMDAVMSISQMPYGIPVGSLPPGNNKPMFDFIEKINSLTATEKKMVNVQIEPNLLNYEYVNKELDRLKKLASEENVELLINSDKVDDNKTMRLQFVHEESVINLNKAVLHVPLMDDNVRKQTKSAMTVQTWIEKGGLWFGVNNSRNALLFLGKWN